jgi:N-acetylornithine carbamoyltransferase
MQTNLRGKDVIDLQEWTKDELDTLLDVAFTLKRDRALGLPHPYLRDKVLAMLFFFSSTRTRTSFEAGMAQLGGHAQFIESRTTQIAHGDTAKEIGEILGRYNDGIAIRNVDWGVGNSYIRDVAKASRVPVLNMQCDIYHPHQALADLMTIIERFGDPRGKTATVSWACQLPKAHQRAPKPGPIAAPVRDERPSGPPPRVRSHGRHRRASPPKRP